MGLYWIRPRKFLPLDSRSEKYIVDHLGITRPDRIPPSGLDYLALADDLKDRFNDTNYSVHSFQELSLAAYEPVSGNEPTQS